MVLIHHHIIIIPHFMHIKQLYFRCVLLWAAHSMLQFFNWVWMHVIHLKEKNCFYNRTNNFFDARKIKLATFHIFPSLFMMMISCFKWEAEINWLHVQAHLWWFCVNVQHQNHIVDQTNSLHCLRFVSPSNN